MAVKIDRTQNGLEYAPIKMYRWCVPYLISITHTLNTREQYGFHDNTFNTTEVCFKYLLGTENVSLMPKLKYFDQFSSNTPDLLADHSIELHTVC